LSSFIKSTCDKCGDYTNKGFGCRDCDWDICSDCFQKTLKKRNKLEIGSKMQSRIHYHELEFNEGEDFVCVGNTT
jgi:hypothetical protein